MLCDLFYVDKNTNSNEIHFYVNIENNRFVPFSEGPYKDCLIQLMWHTKDEMINNKYPIEDLSSIESYGYSYTILQSSDKKIWMVHAEQAAITDFAKHGWFIQFSTMLVTHHPCVECVKLIISAGISKLISPSPKKDPLGIYNFEDAKKMIEESAVEYIELEPLRPINLI